MRMNLPWSRRLDLVSDDCVLALCQVGTVHEPILFHCEGRVGQLQREEQGNFAKCKLCGGHLSNSYPCSLTVLDALLECADVESRLDVKQLVHLLSHGWSGDETVSRSALAMSRSETIAFVIATFESDVENKSICKNLSFLC